MEFAAFIEKQPPPLMKIYVRDLDRNLKGRGNVLNLITPRLVSPARLDQTDLYLE